MVIHLAAIVGAAACDRDPLLATSVNVESVRLLCRLKSPRQLVIYADSRHSVIQEAMRRVKDTAFFGIRALWS